MEIVAKSHLVVVRHRLRNRVVNNITHIGFVDPHSKRYRGANKFDLAFAPLMMAKSTVVRF